MTRDTNKRNMRLGLWGFLLWAAAIIAQLTIGPITTSLHILILIGMGVGGVLLCIFGLFLGILPRIYTSILGNNGLRLLHPLMRGFEFLKLED